MQHVTKRGELTNSFQAIIDGGILTDRSAARHATNEAFEDYKKNHDVRLSPESIAEVISHLLSLYFNALTQLTLFSLTCILPTRIDLRGPGSLIVSHDLCGRVQWVLTSLSISSSRPREVVKMIPKEEITPSPSCLYYRIVY